MIHAFFLFMSYSSSVAYAEILNEGERVGDIVTCNLDMTLSHRDDVVVKSYVGIVCLQLSNSEAYMKSICIVTMFLALHKGLDDETD